MTQADTLKIEIEETDLLFIDTLHRYDQLFKELNLHAKNIKKYIVLHDTANFAFNDEDLYDHASDIVKSGKISEKRGLISAINDFIETNEGKNWFVFDVYNNNNGLTVLKRV